ncbi:MAG: hypothetical protein ASARMPRED_003269 [Alectoria sarmentosa]|nr:MAG: hypothetical protein ASARMPRED_003269 [Alectoria sarmentosa]
MSAEESKDSAPNWRSKDVSCAINPDKTASHLYEVRTQAWNIFPYPSIGNWYVLTLGILDQPYYPEIFSCLQQSQKLLDVGCGFAQDLRHLVFDGALAENVYGVDIEKPFIDLGFELFLDRAKLPSTNFIAADMFDPESDAKNLSGQIDIVYASQFFHLWGWDNQVEVGKAVARLLNPARKSLIVGYQIGAIVPRETQKAPTKHGKMYSHDPASLQKLWDAIGEATGTKWTGEARLDEAKLFGRYTRLDGYIIGGDDYFTSPGFRFRAASDTGEIRQPVFPKTRNP